MEDPGPSSAKRPKLPYSQKLTWDSSLEFSNENFAKELKEGTTLEKRSIERQLDSVVSFPEPKIFAHFASKAYKNKEDDETPEQFEERLQLPVGWKLLTIANNFAFWGTIKGYFGAVFWHPIRRRIVIAHRGTDPTNLDALRADLNGILRNKYVKQMRAACTLTHRIFDAVKECEKERNTHFEIYFTGHSLGAWLAQITTFYLKYMTLKEETFLKNPDPDCGRHAHTEVFDSPGASETLLGMASDFDVRYSGKSTDSDHLDITIYLSSPNFVNCCNSHVGRLYRVYPKIASRKYFFYSRSSHSMDGILEIFNYSDPFLIKEVVDWPKLDPTIRQWKIWKIHKSILGKEYEDFFEWTKDLNYDPKPEDIIFKVAPSNENNENIWDILNSVWGFWKKGELNRDTLAENEVKDEFVTIRYQTKPTRPNQCSPSAFGESEFKFLKNFQKLKILPNSIFDGVENKNKTIEKLRQLTLDDDDESISCDDNADIRQLIPYVKTLLRLYPDLNERVETTFAESDRTKRNYRNINDIYRARMEGLSEMLEKPDWPRLVEFLESKKQICRVLPKFGTDLAVVKTLKTIRTNSNFEVFPFEFPSPLGFDSFRMPDEKNHALILLECKSGSFSSPGNEHFVQRVINRVRERPDLKLILITDKNEPFILNNELESIIDEGITWDELTNETKAIVVKKEVIVFQGDPNKRSLEKLLRRTWTEMDLNHLAHIVNNEILARFLRDEDVIVGKSLTKLGKVYITRKMYQPFIKEDIFKDITHNDVVAVSGINQEDLDKDYGILSKKLRDGIRKGKVQIINSDADFEQLFSRNTDKNLHWLKYEDNYFFIHKTRGSLALIRNHIKHEAVLEYSEETLLENIGDRKTLVISDKPGMGKTTLLTVLAEKIKARSPDQWVVRVNLNDCTEALRTATRIETVSDATKFLLEQILPRGKDTKLNSNFEKKLFEQALTIYGGVVLIFDGFDEISPDYEDTVTSLLKILQGTKVDLLVVTTRPHTKDRLEDSLLTWSHSMVPFTKNNYKDLLIKIWKNRDDGTVEEKDFEEFVDESKEILEINDEGKSFAGIPLHCVLLAEYVIEKFLKGEGDELDVLSLFDLYEGFIRRKMDIYYEEKNADTKGKICAEDQKKIANVSIQKMHRQCALKIILSGDTWDQLDYPEMEDELMEITENAVLKVGLMTNTGDNPQFLHRTIAEFFVLDYTLSLATNLKKNSKKLTILSRAILLKREFGVIRAFLESVIKNGSKAAETKNFLRSFAEFCSCDLSDFIDEVAVLLLLLYEQLESTTTLLFELMVETCPTEIPSFLSIAIKEGTALHMALRYGYTNIALSMLQNIPDINAEDENTSSLLDVPWKYGPRSHSLLKSRHIFNTRDYDGYTPLHLASCFEPTQIVHPIKGADNDVSNIRGSTSLVEAANEGYLEVIRLLLEKGADVNAISDNGLTPLGEASRGGHMGVVRLLLEHGADVKASGKFPTTPLVVVSGEGHLEIVRLLLEHGADVNVCDEYGLNPLGVASSGGHQEIVRFLVEQGADVNVCDDLGFSPLLQASLRRDLEMVRCLLENGADVNSRELQTGRTSLHKASMAGYLDIAELLISKGANVNTVDESHQAPLHLASVRGHADLVSILLKHGANIDSLNMKNNTPLHFAVVAGHSETVRVLLEHGANPLIKNKYNKTPLDLAIKYNYTQIIELLSQHEREPSSPENSVSLELQN